VQWLRYRQRMAKNSTRRSALADAGIAVLAREGSRGLTHRAVDEEAGVPTGTTSNYFRSRDALVAGLFERIGERLGPTPGDLEALFELRLESGRRPELAALLGPWLRAGFEADVAFNRSAGLPGGPREIALFHYAIDGLLLDLLTTPIDPDVATDDVIAVLVAGLLPEH